MSGENFQMKECCGQCPFARSTPKEYLDTMGQNGERFAGQAEGPFMLPCHMTKAFPDWYKPGSSAPLCAGAAKYRANIGVGAYLPDCLGRLPPDKDKVFGTPAELLAHHRGTTVEEAEASLKTKPVSQMLKEELANKRVRVKEVRS